MTLNLWGMAHGLSSGVLQPLLHATGALERRRDAAKVWDLASMAEQRNHKLSAADRRRCREYAVEVLGSHTYEPDIRIFQAVHGQWRDELLPENFFFRMVCRRIYGKFFDVSGAKTKTQFFIRDKILPDIALLFSGQLYTRDMQPVDFKQAKLVLFDSRDRVIFKKDGGGRGIGIQFLEAATFDPAMLANLGNGIFQPLIEPHAELCVPGVSAVTTIRIVTTLRPSGVIRPNYVFLRLGRIGNTYVRPSDTVRIHIDLRSGDWADTGYLADWTPLSGHPDVSYAFSGRTVPQLQAAIDQCLALHAQTPFLPSIGWDVCLDRSERWQLMEWNVPHGIAFAETVGGPVFAGHGWESLWKERA